MTRKQKWCVDCLSEADTCCDTCCGCEECAGLFGNGVLGPSVPPCPVKAARGLFSQRPSDRQEDIDERIEAFKRGDFD